MLRNGFDGYLDGGRGECLVKGFLFFGVNRPLIPSVVRMNGLISKLVKVRFDQVHVVFLLIRVDINATCQVG